MVDIIPKETPKTSKTLNFFFYFSIFIFILAITGYFVLNASLNKNKNTVQALDQEIKQIMTEERVELEKEIIFIKEKIDKFSLLVNNRSIARPVFEIIERSTHPQAWFTDFSFETKESKLSLSGETQNFITLWQQIFIFQQEEKINRLELVNFSINEKGLINFEADLYFNPDIFK